MSEETHITNHDNQQQAYAGINRREILAAGTATLAAASLSTSAQAKTMKSSEVAKNIILAWRKLDVEKVMSYVADDIVWYTHAGGKPPLVGKAAVREFVTNLGKAIKDNEWRVFAMSEQGDTVYCEGVDDFKLLDGKQITVPYLGMMKVKNGLVTEWRDYFDGSLVDKMKKGEFDFAKDPTAALWKRPALF